MNTTAQPVLKLCLPLQRQPQSAACPYSDVNLQVSAYLPPKQEEVYQPKVEAVSPTNSGKF